MNERPDIPEPERDITRKKEQPPLPEKRQGEADEDEIVRIEEESNE